MKYGSVCSGIEAATAAWEPLGWESAWFSEIEAFPSAVLAHRYPNVKNLGDFTKIGEEHGPIELLVGGTPCQSFSVAGGRAGLDDPRGNLAIEFLRLAQRLRPRWLLWENVPGVYSSWSDASEGEEVYEAGTLQREVADFWQDSDFDTFLTLLGQCGYGFAYRTLDAQYFGVPQRRRRVFVVGYLGDWRSAAAVLFERYSLSGHPAPRREKGQGASRGFEVGPGSNRFIDTAPTLDARAKDGPIRNQIGAGVIQETTHTLKGRGAEASEDGTGRGVPLVLGANNHGMRDVDTSLSAKNQRLDGDTETFVIASNSIGLTPDAGPQFGSGVRSDGVCFTLDTLDAHAVAFSQNQRGEFRTSDISPQLTVGGGKPGQGYPAVAFLPDQGSAPRSLGYTVDGSPTIRTEKPPAVAFDWQSGGDVRHNVSENHTSALQANQVPAVSRHGMSVRRLTPRECERLQGFPDDWTAVPYRGKPAADGPRYRAIGNSMAVPVMAWIGQRIQAVEDILRAVENAA